MEPVGVVRRERSENLCFPTAGIAMIANINDHRHCGEVDLLAPLTMVMAFLKNRSVQLPAHFYQPAIDDPRPAALAARIL